MHELCSGCREPTKLVASGCDGQHEDTRHVSPQLGRDHRRFDKICVRTRPVELHNKISHKGSPSIYFPRSSVANLHGSLLQVRPRNACMCNMPRPRPDPRKSENCRIYRAFPACFEPTARLCTFFLSLWNRRVCVIMSRSGGAQTVGQAGAIGKSYTVINSLGDAPSQGTWDELFAKL